MDIPLPAQDGTAAHAVFAAEVADELDAVGTFVGSDSLHAVGGA